MACLLKGKNPTGGFFQLAPANIEVKPPRRSQANPVFFFPPRWKGNIMENDAWKYRDVLMFLFFLVKKNQRQTNNPTHGYIELWGLCFFFFEGFFFQSLSNFVGGRYLGFKRLGASYGKKRNHLQTCKGWWQLKDFCIFIPNLGEMIQFDGCISFQMGWGTNHQLESLGY